MLNLWPANESRAAPYRTGAAGRPTSAHLVKAEFERRAAAGEVCERCRDEAIVLIEWLKKEHPDAAPMTPKTVENRIRAEFRKHINARNNRAG
jgi:hypothetical protein